MNNNLFPHPQIPFFLTYPHQQIPQQAQQPQIWLMQEVPTIPYYYRIPPNSYSPFTFPIRPYIPNAAPYPPMPSKQDIQRQKKKINKELKNLRIQLQNLERQRESQDTRKHVLKPQDCKIEGIKEYHNFIMNNNLVQKVIEDNHKKKIKSNKNTLSSCGSSFSQIQDLPEYKKKTQEYYNMLAPLFFVQMYNAEIVQEKKASLARRYLEIKKKWDKGAKAIDEYSERMDNCHERWPPEFPPSKTKTDNEEDVRKYTAPDQPQLMTRIRRESMCYYNTNGFVEDPEAEHRKFKNRISWSDEEKQIFVEKYVQHPKKFGIIAAALPLKSVKDVIEFYYINRYDLCLKEKEGAFRKRGGRRKVTSEGRSSY